MVHVITVKPADHGWCVSAGGFEPMVFFSGAKAEAAARKLADKLAGGGEATEVCIYLRDGALAGRFGRAAEMAMGV